MSEAASLLARLLYVVKRYLQTVATGGCRWRPRDPDVGASSTSTMAPFEIARVMSRSKPEIMVQSAKAAPCTMIGSTAFKTSAAGRLAQMGARCPSSRRLLEGRNTMGFLCRLLPGSLLALSLQSAPAAAQYPNKPITVIVPFAAGGPTDVVTRLVGDHMSRTLGQTLVIENIGGAGGTLGMIRAAQAQPD